MTTTILKGGHRTQDPRLDRVPQFDPKNRLYNVAEKLEVTSFKTKTWALPAKLRLDQGQEGACTGFCRAYDLACAPKPAGAITNDVAQQLYRLARQNDEWPGENYDGSSVLGAVKAAVVMGYVGEYRWAFNIDDYIAAVSHLGPVANGTLWLDGMYETGPDGLLSVSGSEVGGHSYLTRGVIVPLNGVATVYFGSRRVKIKTDEPLLRGPNSWGFDWGIGGEWLMRASDMERLQKQQGDACISTVAFAKPRK